MVCMETSIEKQISKMLSSEKRGGLPRAMLDVLRVLVVDNGVSWKSELIQDLALLYSFKGGPETVDEGKLDEALRELEKERLVRVEEKVKATLGEPKGVRDELISLADFRPTQIALSKDRVLTSYMRERMAGTQMKR